MKGVAVFQGNVRGTVYFTENKNNVKIDINITGLKPNAKHGFHIHKAGDLRGEGCKLACDHYHKGPPSHHGGPPGSGIRHTGDLGNVRANSKYTYTLRDVTVSDILGRSVIVHAKPDDYGLGGYDDSLVTGHSGARIACAVIGRVE